MLRKAKSIRGVGHGRGVGDVHKLDRRSRRLQGLPAVYTDMSPPRVRRTRHHATRTHALPSSSSAPSTPETVVPTKFEPSLRRRRWRAGLFEVHDGLNDEACQVSELGCRRVASEVVKEEEEHMVEEEAFEEDVDQQVKEEFVEQDEEVLDEDLSSDMEYIDSHDPDCVAARIYDAYCEESVFLVIGCRICRFG